MSKRTAREIRAYLNPQPDNDMPLHDYIAMLEADLPRVLDAATALWERLRIHGLSV